jgi:L,D-transpeptidase ErfK/SrfK
VSANGLGAIAFSALLAAAPATALELPLPAAGDVVGELGTAVTHARDTLLDIGRVHGLGYNEIAAANPKVDPWVPGGGTRVVLPTQWVLPPGPREGIVINLAQLRLFYFPRPAPGEQPRVITLAIGIGDDVAPTPVANTSITRKAVDPIWRPPDSIRKRHAEEGETLPEMVPPGPENPLGSRVLYMDLPGYLIHGTNRPWGVGMRVSNGCIRLYPEDVEGLYEQVPIGTPVRIVNEPILFGKSAGVPVLQAFRPPVGTSPRMSYTELVEELIRRYPRGIIDPAKALLAVKEKRGIVTAIAP